MLSVAIFLPLAALVAVLFLPEERRDLVRNVALGASLGSLGIVVALWIGFAPGGGYQFVDRVAWIPSLGIGYAVGVDGLSLPLVALTALLFPAALLASRDEQERVKEYHVWFLLLETACLGVFAAMDLFLFYVFWDLTLVGMYFVIAVWGHEKAKEAAMTFFLYTFVGSLALLLGILGLYLAAVPHTMDMETLATLRPLAQGGVVSVLVFWALFVGFAIKTPVVPVHTWLPPAHAEAPAPGSAILAGVLLKMGTYGLLRILFAMLPETFERFALPVVVIGLVSVVYGALVALAQTDLKRLVAYTSVNHMGYVVLAVGAVALAGGSETARLLAIDGAVLQMVSHGLITGALFLLTGIIWRRAHTFDIDSFGGLAKSAPVLAAAFGLAAFASLGLPGLSGFVAEFQIFAGVFGVRPWAAAVALTGVVVTAGLFLWTLQRMFLGATPPQWRTFPDLTARERLAVFPLLALVVVIGLFPFWVLAVIRGGSAALLAAAGGP